MIEFYAGSMLDEIKSRVPSNTRLTLSNDSQNAIQFECNDLYSFWKLEANLNTNKFELTEVIVDKVIDLKSDLNYNFLTVSEAIGHIIRTVTAAQNSIKEGL